MRFIHGLQEEVLVLTLKFRSNYDQHKIPSIRCMYLPLDFSNGMQKKHG